MDIDLPHIYKQCRKCGTDITDLNKVKNYNYKDGISSLCSKCNSSYSKEWRKRTKESGTYTQLDLFTVELYCSKCSERLTEDNAVTSSSSSTGYNSWCKRCHRLAARAYRQRIKDGLHIPSDTLQTERICYMCDTPLTEETAYKDKYSATGLDTHCKKCDRIRRSEWAAKHPEQESATKHKRRSRKRDLPSTLTGDDWINCKDYFDCKCVICGSSDHIQMDHWIPLSNPFCPGTVPENIVPLCRSHNAQKNGQHPYKYLVKQLGVKDAVLVYNRVQEYFNHLMR